jgi:predicted transcriptional regulator
LKRRSRLRVIGDVLKIGLDTAVTKSEIMYRANLSFSQVEMYLVFCLKVGLLKKQIKGSRVVYVTTEKGREFGKRLDEIWSLLEIEDGGRVDES